MSTVRETFGLNCPVCGRDEHIVVAVTAIVRLHPDGTESAGDEEWSGESYCACEACHHEAIVCDFYVQDGGAS